MIETPRLHWFSRKCNDNISEVVLHEDVYSLREGFWNFTAKLAKTVGKKFEWKRVKSEGLSTNLKQLAILADLETELFFLACWEYHFKVRQHLCSCHDLGLKKMDSKRVVLLGTFQILPLREYWVPSSYFRVTSDWKLFFIFTIELQNTSTARFTADFLLHFLAKWFRFGLFQQIRIPSTRNRVSLAERVAD